MSKQQKVKAWRRYGENVQLEVEDGSFHISYNASPTIGNTGHAETAIVAPMGKYYILDGDWREEYEKAFDKGLDACIQVFLAHPECVSSWSNQYEPVERKASQLLTAKGNTQEDRDE